MPVQTRPRKPLVSAVLRFGRALIVGSGATALDFAVLTTCIRILGVAPAYARLPALIAGASVQFFGHRTFTFRAQNGAISRQVKFFVAVELVALALNLSLYELLLPHGQRLPPEALSLLGSFAVFVGFAYPMHRLVTFSPPIPERST